MLGWIAALLMTLAWLAAFLVAWRVDFGELVNPWMVTFLSFGVTGVLIVLRRTRHPLGWLLLSLGLSTSLGVLSFTLAFAWLGDGRTVLAGWADAVGNLLVTGMIQAIPASLILFPDGRPPSRRWRALLWLVGLTALLGSTAALLNGGWGGDIRQAIAESPLRAQTAPLGDVVSQIFYIGLAISMVGAAASVLLRFRRSSGLERQQLKWLAAAAFIVAVSLTIVGFDTRQTWEVALVSASFSSIPVSIAVAITRYRLYEIDRIISRTVGYVLVVGLLGGLFFGAVTLLTSIIPAESDLAIAGSTLAVAGLFNPVRRRVQTWVDRRFNRSRFDAQRVMDRFAGSLRDRVDSEEVVDGWVGVVSETMQPSAVAVWIREEITS